MLHRPNPFLTSYRHHLLPLQHKNHLFLSACSLRMGSWAPYMAFLSGLAFFTSPPLRLFTPSFFFPPLSTSMSPFGSWDLLHLFSLFVSGSSFGSLIFIILKTAKTCKKLPAKHLARHLQRWLQASPSTRAQQHAHLMLMTLQIFMAYSRYPYISAISRLDLWSNTLKGIFMLTFDTHIVYISHGLMASRCVVAASVMLVFGLVFAPVIATLVPGKESWLCSLIKTRRLLSTEDLICPEDVSLWSLNLWECPSCVYKELPPSVEASVPPQAGIWKDLSSWTSGHVSSVPTIFVTVNCRHSIHLLHANGVAHDGQTWVSPSPWIA